MQTLLLNKSKTWFKMVALTVIAALLSQNMAIAKDCSITNSKLSADTKLDEDKFIMVSNALGQLSEDLAIITRATKVARKDLEDCRLRFIGKLRTGRPDNISHLRDNLRLAYHKNTKSFYIYSVSPRNGPGVVYCLFSSDNIGRIPVIKNNGFDLSNVDDKIGDFKIAIVTKTQEIEEEIDRLIVKKALIVSGIDTEEDIPPPSLEEAYAEHKKLVRELLDLLSNSGIGFIKKCRNVFGQQSDNYSTIFIENYLKSLPFSAVVNDPEEILSGEIIRFSIVMDNVELHKINKRLRAAIEARKGKPKARPLPLAESDVDKERERTLNMFQTIHKALVNSLLSIAERRGISIIENVDGLGFGTTYNLEIARIRRLLDTPMRNQGVVNDPEEILSGKRIEFAIIPESELIMWKNLNDRLETVIDAQKDIEHDRAPQQETAVETADDRVFARFLNEAHWDDDGHGALVLDMLKELEHYYATDRLSAIRHGDTRTGILDSPIVKHYAEKAGVRTSDLDIKDSPDDTQAVRTRIALINQNRRSLLEEKQTYASLAENIVLSEDEQAFIDLHLRKYPIPIQLLKREMTLADDSRVTLLGLMMKVYRETRFLIVPNTQTIRPTLSDFTPDATVINIKNLCEICKDLGDYILSIPKPIIDFVGQRLPILIEGTPEDKEGHIGMLKLWRVNIINEDLVRIGSPESIHFWYYMSGSQFSSYSIRGTFNHEFFGHLVVFTMLRRGMIKKFLSEEDFKVLLGRYCSPRYTIQGAVLQYLLMTEGGLKEKQLSLAEPIPERDLLDRITRDIFLATRRGAETSYDIYYRSVREQIARKAQHGEILGVPYLVIEGSDGNLIVYRLTIGNNNTIQFTEVPFGEYERIQEENRSGYLTGITENCIRDLLEKYRRYEIDLYAILEMYDKYKDGKIDEAKDIFLDQRDLYLDRSQQIEPIIRFFDDLSDRNLLHSLRGEVERIRKDVTLAASELPVVHPVVNKYIREHLPAHLITEDPVGREREIEENYRLVDGYGVSARVIPITGLYANTGQYGHIGLGQVYSKPVIYIDADYVDNADVINHELYEISKWEDKRKELDLRPSQMRHWIISNISEATALADKWHKEASAIHGYGKIAQTPQAETGVQSTEANIEQAIEELLDKCFDPRALKYFDSISDYFRLELAELIRSHFPGSKFGFSDAGDPGSTLDRFFASHCQEKESARNAILRLYRIYKKYIKLIDEINNRIAKTLGTEDKALAKLVLDLVDLSLGPMRMAKDPDTDETCLAVNISFIFREGCDIFGVEAVAHEAGHALLPKVDAPGSQLEEDKELIANWAASQILGYDEIRKLIEDGITVNLAIHERRMSTHVAAQLYALAERTGMPQDIKDSLLRFAPPELARQYLDYWDSLRWNDGRRYIPEDVNLGATPEETLPKSIIDPKDISTGQKLVEIIAKVLLQPEPIKDNHEDYAQLAITACAIFDEYEPYLNDTGLAKKHEFEQLKHKLETTTLDWTTGNFEAFKELLKSIPTIEKPNGGLFIDVMDNFTPEQIEALSFCGYNGCFNLKLTKGCMNQCAICNILRDRGKMQQMPFPLAVKLLQKAKDNNRFLRQVMTYFNSDPLQYHDRVINATLLDILRHMKRLRFSYPDFVTKGIGGSRVSGMDKIAESLNAPINISFQIFNWDLIHLLCLKHKGKISDDEFERRKKRLMKMYKKRYLDLIRAVINAHKKYRYRLVIRNYTIPWQGFEKLQEYPFAFSVLTELQSLQDKLWGIIRKDIRRKNNVDIDTYADPCPIIWTGDAANLLSKLGVHEGAIEDIVEAFETERRKEIGDDSIGATVVPSDYSMIVDADGALIMQVKEGRNKRFRTVGEMFEDCYSDDFRLFLQFLKVILKFNLEKGFYDEHGFYECQLNELDEDTLKFIAGYSGIDCSIEDIRYIYMCPEQWVYYMLLVNFFISRNETGPLLEDLTDENLKEIYNKLKGIPFPINMRFIVGVRSKKPRKLVDIEYKPIRENNKNYKRNVFTPIRYFVSPLRVFTPRRIGKRQDAQQDEEIARGVLSAV